MSRSGYSDVGDGWEFILWRGAVRSAIRGKLGQQFLRELIVALDTLPNHRLIDSSFKKSGDVCALGSVAKMRGLFVDDIEPDDDGYVDGATVATRFGIAPALAREIMYENDEATYYAETPEARWRRMRGWAIANIGTP